MEEVFVGGEEVAGRADRDTALDNDTGARLGVLQHRLDGEVDTVEVDAAVFSQVRWHGNEIMRGTGEGSRFRCQLDGWTRGEFGRQFLQALIRDVEADAREEGPELLEEAFADEANADDSDAGGAVEGQLWVGADVLHCEGLGIKEMVDRGCCESST